MLPLLHAEVRKIVTTRSILLLAAGVAVYPVLAVVAAATAPGATVAPDTLLMIVRSGADVARVAVLLIGIVAVAGEYRHGTIVPTLLATPRRPAVVLAKIVVLAASGLVVAAVVSAVGIVAGRAYVVSDSAVAGVGPSDVALGVAGAALVVSAYGAIGAGVGWIVRNQAAALSGALIWVLLLEGVLPVVLRAPSLRDWLPGGAAGRLLLLGQEGQRFATVAGAGALLGAITFGLAGLALARTVATDIE